MTRDFHLTFNDDLYEVRVTNGVITRITKYFGTMQIPKECLLDDLPRHVKLAILDEVILEDGNGF